MPSDRAICMNTLSAGTVRTLLMASASGTNFKTGRLERHHYTGLIFVDGTHCRCAVAETKLAVHGCGGTTLGQLSQHQWICFVIDKPLKFQSHCFRRMP